MLSTASAPIKEEIERRFGFFPPFFEPALAQPDVLKNLWDQTRASYVENPLPDLFKEKLAALLARFCSVPYCLISHSSALCPMGMEPTEILALLEQPILSSAELSLLTGKFESEYVEAWPISGSSLEKNILDCCVSIFLNQDLDICHQKLRSLLSEAYYAHLVMFIAYNRMALGWAEAHPELAHEADRRVIRSFKKMVTSEPKLAAFFANYRARGEKQAARREHWLSTEARISIDSERASRIKVEESSRNSELLRDRLTQAVLISEIGFFDWNISADKIYFSPKMQEDWGIAANCSLSDVLAFVHPEDRERVKRLIAESIATGAPYHAEYRVMRPNLNELWIDAKGQVSYDESGTAVRFIGTSVDITARKHLELERSRQKHLLEAIFSGSPAAMAVWRGPDFIFEKLNQPYQDIFPGRPLQDLSFIEAVPEMKGQPFIAQLKRVLETGTPLTGKEVLAKIRSGSDGPLLDRYFDYTYVRVSDEKGNPYGVYDHAIDVTERVMAKRLLVASERQFQEISNTLPIMIWIASSEGKITWSNSWWYSHTDSELLDWRSPAAPIHPEDREKAKETWARAHRIGEVFTIDIRLLQSRDQEFRWHACHAVPLKDENGNVIRWVGSNVDIHDRKTLVAELETEKEMRERFVSSLTHDLRTPLTSARMSAQLISRRSELPDAIKRNASRIVGSMDRADAMIRDLLDLTRLKAGEDILLNISYCSLETTLSHAVRDLELIHGDRFKLLAELADPRGFWDCEAIRRIIENLASNAVKYGNSQAKIEIRLSEKRGGMEISVRNEGNPISCEDQKGLFQAFQRTDSAVRGSKTGWGIGLALVKWLTEAHGGSVSLVSNQTIGTIFSVWLPLDSRKAANDQAEN